MIVGLDAKRIVRNGTGLGSFGRTLANDLAAIPGLQLRLYTPDLGRDELRSQVPERSNLCYCLPRSTGVRGYGGAGARSLWRTFGIVRQLQADGVDIYHGLSGELPVGIRKSGIRSVVTIHDLIFMRHPEYYHWLDVQLYKWKFRRTLQEADAIVAISECTRRDICELGGVPEDRVHLIYQSCAPRFSKYENSRKEERGTRKEDTFASKTVLAPPYPRTHVPPKTILLPPSSLLAPRKEERYILSVGTIEARKNTLLLVEALPLLPPDVHLVLLGRRTPYTRKVEARAAQLSVTPRLHLLHGVPDSELPAIYAAASVFAYPSRYEGFGIPIIEAISMGLPVVACTGSCLEEAGGPHSLYVGPDDAPGMAHALQQMLTDGAERTNRIVQSRDYIRRFENTGAARQYADLYESLLSRPNV